MRKLSPVLALSVLALSACLHRQPTDNTPPAPIVPVREVSATPPASTGEAPAATLAETGPGSEPYIEMLTASNEDVRLVLQKIAQIGKLDLVIPGNIHKTISVRYVHVPVSVALKDVLKRSGLQLSSGTRAPLPFDTASVFYRLPANVDSMSVDGIMKRFGVGRDIAELIVKSRPPS